MNAHGLPALEPGQPVWITTGGYGVKIGTGAVVVTDGEDEGYGPRVAVRLAKGKVIKVTRSGIVPLLPGEHGEDWMHEVQS
jgi:hypothetical protein